MDIDGTSGDDILVGTSGDDWIRAFAGNDSLDGAGGSDVLEGGEGDDTYYVHGGEVIVELLNQGNDAVYTDASFVLTPDASVELVSTTSIGGLAAINLTGNALAQQIWGNNGNNILNGGGGADYIIGFGGDDTYYVVSGQELFAENVGQGRDVVYTFLSYALIADASMEVLSVQNIATTTALNLTGNAFAQEIYGNNGDNVLIGGGGQDFLIGFGGDDTFYVQSGVETIAENVGQGRDVVYTFQTYAITAGAEIEVLSAQSIGSTNAMNLTGNGLAQEIYGNNGDNVLIGGGGQDYIIGFGGNDTYYVGSGLETFVENAGQGHDVVYTSQSYALIAGASMEVLSTTSIAGTNALNLTGNELGQEIYGNNGNNVLIGGGGADYIVGYGGDDTYYVHSGVEIFVENAGQGRDVVYTLQSHALAAGVSMEVLSAQSIADTAAISLTGNEFGQEIYGNEGANVINGGGGNDLLQGNGGADSFAFTTALGAGNIDTVTDFSVADDTISLGGAAGQPFAILATGNLRAGTLVIGAAALDADDYLIYNSGTGALLFDADGNGAGAAVQVATLSTGLALTIADFVVTGLANNAPAVTSGGTASIAENTAASTVVYQAAATDADGDRITWSLSGTDAALLTIDANGAVRLINPADFETKASYVFNVVASDSGVSTPRAVTLTITDVNEGGGSTPTINETASPNNSRLNAQSIDPGTFVIANNPNLDNDDYPSATIVGSISDNADVDYYSITLEAGQQLILDIDGTTNSLDSFLQLYGPNSGTLIGENDDRVAFDPGSNPPFGHNTDSQIIFRAATSGTYYFAVSSFENSSSGNYLLHVSINDAPTTPAQIMAEDIDALISGAEWNHTNLTFGFPALASYYPQDFDEVVSEGGTDPTPSFDAFNATQQAATRSLLQMIANVSPLTFAENTTQGNFNVAGTAANADLRFAESSQAEVAYAYYPSNQGPGSEGGSAWFNFNDDFTTPTKGNYAWMGILHEIGHALGLKHGHEFPLAVSAGHDTLEYTVMTYRSYVGDSIEGGYNNETWGYAQTLMMLDIAALQEIYGGANYSFNNTASTYTWSSTTGEMSINGVGQGAPGNAVNASANRIFMTIWDGGGIDTYDLSNYVGFNTIIDLRPGEWTTTGAGQLVNLGNGNFARGNIANALLFEGNTASAIENAKGGGGTDTLIANLVANQLTGNGLGDTFKWMSTGDAGTGALADTVMDFVRGADKIDFTALDALPGTAGQQDFTFIGTGAFTNAAGQVRYDVTGGNAHVFADVDGNGTADMQIILNGITTLASSDFNF